MTPLLCRVCGKGNAGHTPAGALPAVPHDGDYSLCAYCGAWSVFDGAGLRAPTPAEIAEIEADPDCAAALRIVETIEALRNRRRVRS